jgi:Ca2+/Na+ antiporter
MILVLVLAFFMSKFIVSEIHAFVIHTQLDHFFVGITFLTWGSNNIQFVKQSIYLKNDYEDVGLKTVLIGSVILLLFAMPLAIILRMIKFSDYDLKLIEAGHNREQIILPVIIIVTIFLVVYLLHEMHLRRFGAVILFLTYWVYIGYITSQF